MSRRVRFVAMVTFVLLCSIMVSGSRAHAQDSAKEKKIVVCSTTQIADFARQIVGDDWEVQCVLAPGQDCLLYTSPSPRDRTRSRMPSSA